jgi:competence protein ComEC
LVVATLVWATAFAFMTGVWWPLIVLLAGATLAICWLRAARPELLRLLLLIAGAISLLSVRLYGLGGNSATSELPKSNFSDWPPVWPFEQLRSAAKQALIGINRDAEALTLGLAIGDSSLASETLLLAMKETSLTHLVAVSGSNCAIVAGAVFLALQRLGVRARVIWSLLALAAYVMLVGPQPSVLRAATMAAAILIAYLSGRKTSALVALAVSITFLVIASPEISIEYGFSLSVAATAGILLLAPRIYENLKRHTFKWAALALSVSAASQLLCFPILLQLQPRLPTYSLIANLFSEPLVAPVTVLAILAVSLSWFQPAAAVLFWLASAPASFIAAIAHYFSGLPLSSTFWAGGILGTIAAGATVLAAAILILTRKPHLRLLSGVLVGALCTASISMFTVEAVRVATWPQSNWQIASCDVGQGDATVLKSAGKVAVIDVGKFDAKVDRCLDELSVSRIDLLVLTHFDQDHVLATSAAIADREVSTVLISPFSDDRPAAKQALSALANKGIAVVKAQKWLSGKLGRATWLVLNPSRTAEEAEDSNDASIAMLFRFEDFSFLALADLGERGQMRIAEDLDVWRDDWVEKHDMVLKVSHHGSADQYAELMEHLAPNIALISVGKSNGYGHPTRRTLELFERTRSLICRTDQLGSLALSRVDGGFAIANTAAG